MAIGILEVLLVNAKGLEDKDLLGLNIFGLGKMDPYVIVKYKSQERRSNVARGEGGNPTWNEKLTFRVEFPGEGDDYKLILTIVDKDTFSSDDFVGQATYENLIVGNVKDLLAVGVENGSAELHPCKYSVVNTNQSYSGHIEVGVTFTLKEEECNEEEEYGGWKESCF